MYLIAAAAHAANLSPDTVRNYCRLGLLDPIRDSAGRRLFTASDIQKIREIRLENQARKTPPQKQKLRMR